MVPGSGPAETIVSTSTTSYVDPIATQGWGETYAARTLQSNIADKAMEYGLASRADLESMAAAWRAWGRDPDALFCLSHVEVVASKR